VAFIGSIYGFGIAFIRVILGFVIGYPFSIIGCWFSVQCLEYGYAFH